MRLSPALTAELVEFVAQRTKRARITIVGTSMQPLLNAGMVVDIEPFTEPPRVGDILVFRSQTGLVAHRLVGGELFAFRAHSGIVAQRLMDRKTNAFITCGDAYPDRAEVVPSHFVIGRVTAVWTSALPDAQRIDDWRYQRLGVLLARTRALRSMLVKARAFGSVLCADPALIAAPTFSILTAATRMFEQHQYAAGVALLDSILRKSAIDMARRHHLSGLISHWLDEASQAGIAVPADLHEPFRRIRWTNALQAGRVLTCVRDVRDAFAGADIPHIFLKGGARLAGNEPGADLQFSGDLDVIVPAELAVRALTTLRGAGYRDIRPEHKRADYASSHHREPLRSPHVDLPVEVHVTLARPAVVSRRLDYAALASSSRLVNGPVGEVRILDAVLSAVHLAYHARDLQVWRDIVLLSRLLRTFDGSARARFDAHINAEKRDGLRLTSAVAAADRIAFGRTSSIGAVKRYTAWAELREDLPRRFAHSDIVEAVLGRCRIPRLQLSTVRRDPQTWLRCWARNLVLLPMIVRAARRRHARGTDTF